MAAYLIEVAGLRNLLDNRYDDIKSGRVKPVDGEAFFEDLRQRESDLSKRRHALDRPTLDEIRKRLSSRLPVRPRPTLAAAVRAERNTR